MDNSALPLIMRCNHNVVGRVVMRGFSLAQASEGETVKILTIDGGTGAHRKLIDLGLAPGQRVQVLTRQPGGPVLLAVGPSRVAIGFGLALKVKVGAVTNRGGEG